MKLPSNQLEAFYAVARTQSFSKGAKLIHVTQSAVSQRIGLLEEALGASLIIRDRSHLRLTVLGLKLLRHCQLQEQSENDFFSGIEEQNRGSASDQRSYQGTIRIGGFSSILRSAVLPAISPLLRNNPLLGLTVVTKELSDLLNILKQAEVDFVISHKNPNKEDIEAIHLGVEENVLVESKKHTRVDTYLDHDDRDITTAMYFKIAKISQSNIKKRYLDDVYGLMDGVKLGLGRAIVPKHLIKDEESFKIIQAQSVLKVDLYLLFYRQSFYSSLHEEVRKEIVQYFKKNF